MRMWKRALEGEVERDVTTYKHIITSAFQHEALPFKGYPFPREGPGGFVLIERKSHTALYDRIAAAAEKNTRNEALHLRDNTSSIVVIGPVDTGNSSSLNHVFLRCAAMKGGSEGSGKRGKPVIVCDRPANRVDHRYFIFTPGPDPKVEVSSIKPAALNDHRTIYLYDSPENPGVSKKAHVCRAFTVIASSPNRANYNVVGEAATRFYAYRWEPEEVKEAEKALELQVDPTAVEHCGFKISFLTGMRAVKDVAVEDLRVALGQVINSSTLTNMVNAISAREGELLFWSNRLFTMISPKMAAKMYDAEAEEDGVKKDDDEEGDPKRFLDFAVWPVSEYARDQLKLRLCFMSSLLTFPPPRPVVFPLPHVPSRPKPQHMLCHRPYPLLLHPLPPMSRSSLPFRQLLPLSNFLYSFPSPPGHHFITLF